jgi:hypothetical protein
VQFFEGQYIKHCIIKVGFLHAAEYSASYPTITYYWAVTLILDHSYLVGNLKNSKIAETKALEPQKF